MGDEILTIREVADLLKINEKTAYRLAAEAKSPVSKSADHGGLSDRKYPAG